MNTISDLELSSSTETDSAVQQTCRLRLERMFNDHHDFIWRLLRRLGLSRPAADDAAQHVFLVAAERILDIQEGRERAFLFGTALRVARRVESGVLSINSHSSVHVEAPFGGFKQSGLGRDLGMAAMEGYTELKNVYVAD